jgi:hypothetical protein
MLYRQTRPAMISRDPGDSRNLEYHSTEITMMTGSDFGLRHGGEWHEPLALAISVKAPTAALATEGSKTQLLIYESSRP